TLSHTHACARTRTHTHTHTHTRIHTHTHTHAHTHTQTNKPSFLAPCLFSLSFFISLFISLFRQNTHADSHTFTPFTNLLVWFLNKSSDTLLLSSLEHRHTVCPARIEHSHSFLRWWWSQVSGVFLRG